MKRQGIASVSALAMFAGVAALFVTSPARAENPKFSCAESQGVPATVATTSRGNIPVIRWVSSHFGDSGYSPQYRCQVVSPKFQQYLDNGTLNYLTTGYHNSQPIVCVAKEKGGPCTGVLFTLKPGSDPWKTLTRLMDVRVQAGPPLNESTGGASADTSRYIDMNEFLNNAPVENAAAPAVTPGQAAPGNATGLW